MACRHGGGAPAGLAVPVDLPCLADLLAVAPVHRAALDVVSWLWSMTIAPSVMDSSVHLTA
jgi:hypothetical protein